uniref:Uncharacterized protein n=1 Tax=Sphaeramia orbicularis TaxID=375764 RepID=A0A673D0S2_9TELE
MIIKAMDPSGKRIMSCMHKPWTATQKRPWNQSRNLSSKYKTSTTMHPNFQMDPLSLRCLRCLNWVIQWP